MKDIKHPIKKCRVWEHPKLRYGSIKGFSPACWIRSHLQASVIINGTRASLPFREEIPHPWWLTHSKTVHILDLSDNCFCPYECTPSLLPLPASVPGDCGMDSFVFYFKKFCFFSTSKSRSFLMSNTSLTLWNTTHGPISQTPPLWVYHVRFNETPPSSQTKFQSRCPEILISLTSLSNSGLRNFKKHVFSRTKDYKVSAKPRVTEEFSI